MVILKRLAAPKFWKIPRKVKKFVISPRPGPHQKKLYIPLGVIIRDYLKYAETLKEVKKILNQKIVSINGKIRKDYRFPVGLMDVLRVGDMFYRVMPNKNGLYLKEISDSNIKLSKVVDKTYIKKNNVQINLHDGTNFVVKRDEDKFKTGDVIVFDLTKNERKEVLKLEKGCVAVIAYGAKSGKICVLDEIKIIRSLQPNIAIVKIDEKQVKIPKDYIFVIGKEKPIIQI